MEITKNDKVLFVDDEKLVLKSLQRELLNEPFTKFFTTDTIDAFKILTEHDVSVVVSDLTMPGIGGLKFLRLVNEQFPEIIRIVLTGEAQMPLTLKAQKDGHIFKYITKPWNTEDDFIPTLRQAIELYKINSEWLKLESELKMDTVNSNSMDQTDSSQNSQEVQNLNKTKEKLIEFMVNEIDPYLKKVKSQLESMKKDKQPISEDDLNYSINNGEKLIFLISKIKAFYFKNIKS